jgi:hypothetical protein
MEHNVSVSWIFNRLLDEPERLKSELIEQTAKLSNQGGIDFRVLSMLFEKYRDVRAAEAVAADLRVVATTEIKIANDHNYIKATCGDPPRTSR